MTSYYKKTKQVIMTPRNHKESYKFIGKVNRLWSDQVTNNHPNSKLYNLQVLLNFDSDCMRYVWMNKIN